jgi:Spy/CpxP family protein refolding chaperone
MKMTKSKKTIFSAVAICIAIVFASVASVNASNSEMAFDTSIDHQRNMHKVKRMAKALSLSKEQRVQIKEIKRQAKEEHQSLRVSMKQFKNSEKKLLQATSFNEKSFSDLYEAYQPTFAQLALTKVKIKHAIFKVLTEEQQRKWLKMMEHHKGNTNKGRG